LSADEEADAGAVAGAGAGVLPFEVELSLLDFASPLLDLESPLEVSALDLEPLVDAPLLALSPEGFGLALP
jgi:hypothetical protein